MNIIIKISRIKMYYNTFYKNLITQFFLANRAKKV